MKNGKGAIGLLSQVMCDQVRRLRLLYVASVAIAGILWGAPAVTACTAEKAATSACCCAPQTSADCGCCSKAEHHRETTLPLPERVPGTSFTGTRVACHTCVCGQPTSPARQSERRETRASEESTSEAPSGTIHVNHLGSPSLALCSVTQTEPFPSHTPLYLRVEHLII